MHTTDGISFSAISCSLSAETDPDSSGSLFTTREIVKSALSPFDSMPMTPFWINSTKVPSVAAETSTQQRTTDSSFTPNGAPRFLCGAGGMTPPGTPPVWYGPLWALHV